MTMLGGCLICGARHAVCGQPSSSTPVDHQVIEAKEGPGMGLRKYEVEINGAKTVMKLDDEAAKALGVYKADEPATKKREPANKSRAAKSKG